MPHRKHLWVSTECYGDSFTFLYVDDVRASQETHIWAFTACNDDRFAFFFTFISHSPTSYLSIGLAMEIHLQCLSDITLRISTAPSEGHFYRYCILSKLLVAS
jgi:hypothetical protein